MTRRQMTLFPIESMGARTIRWGLGIRRSRAPAAPLIGQGVPHCSDRRPSARRSAHNYIKVTKLITLMSLVIAQRTTTGSLVWGGARLRGRLQGPRPPRWPGGHTLASASPAWRVQRRPCVRSRRASQRRLHRSLYRWVRRMCLRGPAREGSEIVPEIGMGSAYSTAPAC